jgi:quinol-cytochrome oxidoreductase complex cytochrome b subunit
MAIFLHKGLLGSQATAALHVIVLPAVLDICFFGHLSGQLKTIDDQ